MRNKSRKITNTEFWVLFCNILIKFVKRTYLNLINIEKHGKQCQYTTKNKHFNGWEPNFLRSAFFCTHTKCLFHTWQKFRFEVEGAEKMYNVRGVRVQSQHMFTGYVGECMSILFFTWLLFARSNSWVNIIDHLSRALKITRFEILLFTIKCRICLPLLYYV